VIPISTLYASPEEQQERLVLGLPAKTSDRAVIAVVVRLAGDRMAGEDDIRPTVNPERSLHGYVIVLVCEDHLVRDLFDQTCAKDRGGNPEESRCGGRAPARSPAALACSPARPPDRQCEQVVDATVRRSVRIPHEPRLAYGPVQRDE